MQNFSNANIFYKKLWICQKVKFRTIFPYVDTILTNNKDSYNKPITEYLVLKNFMEKFLIIFLTLFLFSCGNHSARNPKNPQMENEKQEIFKSWKKHVLKDYLSIYLEWIIGRYSSIFIWHIRKIIIIKMWWPSQDALIIFIFYLWGYEKTFFFCINHNNYKLVFY